MRVPIAWGRQILELEIREENLVLATRAPITENLADPVKAMRDALEHPIDYPPLRQSLTPADCVAVLVDETIPNLGQLLVPVLEQIHAARVPPDAITLICPSTSAKQPWLDDLPDEFQDVHVEIHQPGDRKKLAYLAATGEGRRIYLNRTAVDCDQLVVMTRRSYDPLLRIAGAETSLYPGVTEEEALQELRTQLTSRAPGKMPSSLQKEAREIAWLLGAPFFVQIIDGAGDGIADILSGPLECSDIGIARLNTRWRVEVARPADVVVASITGDPARITMHDLAQAFFHASRVVQPGGSIILLTEAAPERGPAFGMMRGHDDPSQALSSLMLEMPPDLAAGFMWTTAAEQARLYLHSGLNADDVEDLFAVHVEHATQVRNLLTEDASCIVLSDAHRTLAVLV